MLTRIHKPDLLESLFSVGCKYSSGIVSNNKIVGQLQDAGNTTTLAHYLTLLDNTGLLSGLGKYIGNSYTDQTNSSPKFIVQNTEFMGSTSTFTLEEAKSKSEYWGNAVESTVGAHFINFYKVHGYEFLYWRHVNDEVDFVIKNDQKTIAIEEK